MIGAALIFAILLFTVIADQIQAPWPHAVFRGAACLLCAACIIAGIRRQRLHGSWAALSLALPALWGLLQLGLDSTVWRFATWHATLQWFAYLALFLAALQQTILRSQLRVIPWFGGAFSIYAIAQYLTWTRAGEPMMATFLNQNHYAALMELLFPVALWRLVRDKNKPIYAICGLAILASVAISGSRAGILLLLLELLYVGLRTTLKPLYIATGALAIAIVSIGLTWNRFQTLSTNEPFESRNATARASIQMLRDKPQLGYGLGTWANIYPAYAERDTGFRLIHADDDWLEWAAEGGIPMVAIMLLIAAFAVRAAWQEPWCAGCVAVLLHSLVEFPMQKQALWAWFVVLLAIAQTKRKSDSARWKQAS
jgi:O-antigen ligase